MVYNVFLSSVLFQRKISMEPKHTKYMKDTPGRLGGLSPPHWVHVSFPLLAAIQPCPSTQTAAPDLTSRSEPLVSLKTVLSDLKTPRK